MSLLPPGATIGILGGGQLGRMTAMAAARLGYRCHILAPEPDSPAADVAAAFTCADYGDAAALAAFAAAVDVVTLEFENVPVPALELLARHKPVRPGAEVLRVTQDRLAEKSFVAGLGIGVTAFARVGSAAELAEALAGLGQGVLKTNRLGYDGKGQRRLGPDSDPAEAVAALGQAELIFEAWVDFALELSVITARSPAGEQRSYVAVENRHKHHILDVTLAPAAIPAALAAEAQAIAERIARGRRQTVIDREIEAARHVVHHRGVLVLSRGDELDAESAAAQRPHHGRLEAALGGDTVEVLEKNQVHVDCPEQNCCGMPGLNSGDLDWAISKMKKNVESLYPYAKEGYRILAINPTCSLTLKKEYVSFLPPEHDL